MSERTTGVTVTASIFFVQAGLAVCSILGIIGYVVMVNSAGVGSAEEQAMLTAMGVGAMCMSLILLTIFAATGYGLLNTQGWARWVAIIFSVLNLCSFPIGTALGGITIYYLFFDEETKRAFGV